MSRQYVSYRTDPIDKKDYDPMGANGGGPAHVYDDGRLSWPNGRYDLCGEPWDKPNKILNYPRITTGTYKAGSTISVHWVVTANHWGRFELRVCPLGATAADRERLCPLLQRADGRGPHWDLPPGELPDAQGRPLVPLIRDGTYDMYAYPGNDDFRDTPVFVVNFTLPAGFTCDKCILHWYWLTGNSCNPPCEPYQLLYPECDRNAMGYCGQPGTKRPEEFFSCSDITITSEPAAITSVMPPSVLRRARNATAGAAARDPAAEGWPTPPGSQPGIP